MRNPFEIFATTFPDFPNAVCAKDYVQPDWWFPENIRSADGRKQILDYALSGCKVCPHLQECLQYATDNGIVDGIWGGTIMSEKLKTEHEYSKSYQNYQRVKELLNIGFTLEKACEEVGIKTNTFSRYEFFEKDGWRNRPITTKKNNRRK